MFMTATDYLRSFSVSPDRGFLPAADPDDPLPADFALWEQLLNNWHRIMQRHVVRHQLECLPPFPVASVSEQCLERAFLLLSMAAHAYVHGEDPEATRLPAFLAQPWVVLAERLGRPPILAHASLVLQNWRRMDPDGPIRVENLRPLYQFLGTRDEAWFYLVTVEIEARGAAVLLAMTEALLASEGEQEQEERVAAGLQQVADLLPTLTAALLRMEEGCAPERFYQDLRPLLASFHEVEYEGLEDLQPRSYAGGSAAQSSLLQALEAGLGLLHEEPRSAAFLRSMQRYMPPPHRALIQDLGEKGKRFSEKMATRSAWQARRQQCASAFLDFRNAHLRIVSTYIRAQAGSYGPGHTGTGGTDPMPFLKQLRNDSGQQAKGG